MGIRVTRSITIPIKDWIRNFLTLFKKKKEEEFTELRRDFISTLWGLWLHRNEIVFWNYGNLLGKQEET